jgi:trimeric autotransporter adhesin
MITATKETHGNYFRPHYVIFVLFILWVVSAGVIAVSLSPGSSSSSSAVIAKGDPVYIQGIATGHPQNGLQVWVIGNNYLKVSTISTNADNTYEYELTQADTLNLASGQYFVLIQHPMMNGQFDVYYNPSNGQVINRVLGGGTPIFQMSGSGSLQSPNSASALVQAISSQNIDDTFATVSFFVNEPAAFINPIGTHSVGDRFTVSGNTNLAVDDKLLVEIYSSSFNPTSKQQSGEFYGATGVVSIVPGSGGYNQWSFDVDTSTFKPDEYLVQVSGMLVDMTGSATFNVIQGPVTTIPTIVPVTVIITTPETLQTTIVPPSLPTTKQAPVFVATGIAAVLIALVIRYGGRY